MDFEQVRTYLKVIELNSFSKTAEKLFVTQPTISNRINALEEELDCKLFERNGRAFKLTREGEVFAGYAKQIMEQTNGAKEALRLMKKPQARIGFTPSFSTNMISKTLKRIDINQFYVSIWKGVRSNELTSLLLNNEIDIVFTTTPVNHHSLAVEKIFSDQFVFVVNPNHNLAQYEQITKDLLDGETLICYQRDLPLWKEIEKKIIDVRLNRMEINDIDMIKQLVSMGWGFSILPALTLYENDPNLIAKPFQELDDIPKYIYAVYHNRALEMEYTQVLLDCVKEELDSADETFARRLL